MRRHLKYLILGAGVGEAIALKLMLQPDTSMVVIGDANLVKATVIAKRLNSLGLKAICQPIEFNAETDTRSKTFIPFDALISALPAKYNFAIAVASIMAGKHYIDLGGVLTVSEQISQLDKAARIKEVTAIVSSGLMPGTGSVIARKLAYKKPDGVVVMVGGLPQDPKPPFYYVPPFSLEGLEHLCYDPVKILKNGVIRTVRPFTDYERLTFPELIKYSAKFNGEVEIFKTAGADMAPWIFKDLGLKNFHEATIRWPSFVKFVKDIPREEFKRTIASTIDIPIGPENPDLVIMKVVATKNGEETESYTLHDEFDKATGLTAMQRTTGFPTAILARMAAQGKLKKGVSAPEVTLSSQRSISEFLNTLSKYFKITYQKNTH